MIRIQTAEKLVISISGTRKEMGAAAAMAIADSIRKVMEEKEEVNMIFAAAPSQNESLACLAEKEIDWSRVNAFHMDEYVGLEDSAPQRFGNFLHRALFGKLPFRRVHYIQGNDEDTDAECKRYQQLLEQYPVDIVCLGIGENGHLAFNDPPVADFNDPFLVKKVELELACRLQQVNDGCFARLEEVPTCAITLTIPALMKGRWMHCVVPGNTKTDAVYNTVTKPISECYPSTILRTHNRAVLYLDPLSASRI